MVTAAAAAGLQSLYFDDPAAAGEFVRSQARAGDAVLFKGSRGVRVERALERFLA
jgi:UDP-N-acetylmuramoyl-tripeptide--D-alanyl-D-alanine ligase